MTDEQQAWLRPVGVAEVLGVHVKTVKRIDPADLPFYRFGRRGDRLYSADDVDAYIRSRRVGR